MTRPEPASATPEQRTEAMRSIAKTSATAYIDGCLEGMPRSEIDPHRAFVDGFLTAIELLLTSGNAKTSKSDEAS